MKALSVTNWTDGKRQGTVGHFYRQGVRIKLGKLSVNSVTGAVQRRCFVIVAGQSFSEDVTVINSNGWRILPDSQSVAAVALSSVQSRFPALFEEVQA